MTFGARNLSLSAMVNWTPTSDWTVTANVTEVVTPLPPPLVFSVTYKVIGGFLCFSILLAGLLGNALVVTVVSRSKSMRTPTNCYLISLSVADTVVLLSATLPFSVGLLFKYAYHWPYGKPCCAISTFSNYMGIDASALSITAFTIERYIAICHPMKARRLCTVNRAIKIIAGIWIFSIIYNGVWLFTTQVVDIEYNDGGAIKHCQLDPTIPKFINQAAVILDMTLFYCIPMIVVAVLYGRIAQILCQKSRLPSHKGTYSPRGADRGPSLSSSRSQVVKMLVTIVVIFALAWIPYRAAIIKTLFQVNPDVVFDEWYFLFARLLIFANSAINPIIYNSMSAKFRHAFRKQVCCWVSSNAPHTCTFAGTVTSHKSSLMAQYLPRTQVTTNIETGTADKDMATLSLSAHNENQMAMTQLPDIDRDTKCDSDEIA